MAKRSIRLSGLDIVPLNIGVPQDVRTIKCEILHLQKTCFTTFIHWYIGSC